MPRSLNTARGAFKKLQDGSNPRKQLDSSRVRRMAAPVARREPVPEQSEEEESGEEEPVEEEPVEEEAVKEEPVKEEPQSPNAARGPVSKFPGGVNPRKKLDSSRVRRMTAPRVRPQPAPEPSEEDESMEDAPEEEEPEEEESEEEESPTKKRGDPFGCKPGAGKRKRDDSDDDDDDHGNGSDNDEDDDNAGDSRPRKKARADPAPTQKYNMKRVPTTRWNRKAAESFKKQDAKAEGGDAVQARRVEDWNPKNPGDLEWTVRGIIGERVNAKGKVEYLIDWEATRGHEWDPTWEPEEMLAKDRDQTIAAWEELKFARARAEAEALVKTKMDLGVHVFEALGSMSKEKSYPEKQREMLFRRTTRAGRKPNLVLMI